MTTTTGRLTIFSKHLKLYHQKSSQMCKSIHRCKAFASNHPSHVNSSCGFLSVNQTVVVVKANFHCSSRRLLVNATTPDELMEFKLNIQKWMEGPRFPQTDLMERKISLQASASVFYSDTAIYCNIAERKRLPWFKQEKIASFDEGMAFKHAYWRKAILESGPEVDKANAICRKLIDNNRDFVEHTPAQNPTIWVLDPTKVTDYSKTRINYKTERLEFMPYDVRNTGPCSQANGYIYLPDALVREFREEMLAAVLAHELSHIILNHAAEKLSINTAMEMMMLQSVYSVTKNAPYWKTRDAETFAKELIQHIRDEFPSNEQIEFEADYVGFKMLVNSGVYKPIGFPRLFDFYLMDGRFQGGFVEEGKSFFVVRKTEIENEKKKIFGTDQGSKKKWLTYIRENYGFKNRHPPMQQRYDWANQLYVQWQKEWKKKNE